MTGNVIVLSYKDTNSRSMTKNAKHFATYLNVKDFAFAKHQLVFAFEQVALHDIVFLFT